jgi:hypothetical protein
MCMRVGDDAPKLCDGQVRGDHAGVSLTVWPRGERVTCHGARACRGVSQREEGAMECHVARDVLICVTA